MRITAGLNITNVDLPEEQIRFIQLFLQQVQTALNNNLNFTDNFASKTSSVTFSASNTDTAIAHGLGRVPEGYIVVGRSADLTVYNGASANTTQLLYLRASATGTANILVF